MDNVYVTVSESSQVLIANCRHVIISVLMGSHARTVHLQSAPCFFSHHANVFAPPQSDLRLHFSQELIAKFQTPVSTELTNNLA